MDNTSFRAVVRVRSLDDLDWVFWVIAWLDVSALFLLGSIGKLRKPLEGTITVVFVFALDNGHFFWFLLWASQGQAQESSDEDLETRIHAYVNIGPLGKDIHRSLGKSCSPTITYITNFGTPICILKGIFGQLSFSTKHRSEFTKQRQLTYFIILMSGVWDLRTNSLKSQKRLMVTLGIFHA